MRMMALALAQLQDIVRNPLLVLFTAVPPLLGLTVRLAMPESAQPFLTLMLSVMAPYFIGWNVAGVTLAEEKEKRQLEALLLTPVRPWQVVAVKGALAVAVTLLAGIVSLAIFGRAPARPLLWFLSFLLLALFTVSAGTLMGLLLKDMRSWSVGGTPVQILLIFATTLPWTLAAPAVWEVQAWLPTRPAMELMRAGLLGDDVPVLRDGLVMLAYTGLIWLANARLIRRLAFALR